MHHAKRCLAVRHCSSTTSSATVAPRTIVFGHSACEQHYTPNHPERPERVKVIAEGLKSLDLEHREAPLAEKDQLEASSHREKDHTAVSYLVVAGCTSGSPCREAAEDV